MSRYYVNRRQQRREELKREALSIVAFVLLIMASTVCVLRYTSDKDRYYYVDNGYGGYEQVIERPCEVVEINGDEITVVTRNGELFAFYGEDFKVGETILCTFTMANEIIDAQ